MHLFHSLPFNYFGPAAAGAPQQHVQPKPHPSCHGHRGGIKGTTGRAAKRLAAQQQLQQERAARGREHSLRVRRQQDASQLKLSSAAKPSVPADDGEASVCGLCKGCLQTSMSPCLYQRYHSVVIKACKLPARPGCVHHPETVALCVHTTNTFKNAHRCRPAVCFSGTCS